MASLSTKSWKYKGNSISFPFSLSGQQNFDTRSKFVSKQSKTLQYEKSSKYSLTHKCKAAHSKERRNYIHQYN